MVAVHLLVPGGEEGGNAVLQATLAGGQCPVGMQ